MKSALCVCVLLMTAAGCSPAPIPTLAPATFRAPASGLDVIRVMTRDTSRRAATVSLRGRVERTLTGEELRAVLAKRFGPGAVRSTLFDIRREGEAFVFEGRGFGQGVGLCQPGALARIRDDAEP